MTTETLASYEDDRLTVTSAQLELVKRTVAKGATDENLQLFLHDCRRRGVHPLDKLLVFTQFGTPPKYTPITSIDYMRSRAAETEQYAGSDDAAFTGTMGDLEDDFRATVTVWRLVGSERCPFSATARWSEYCPLDAKGQPKGLWQRMPHTMLSKCAEALALRKGFPQQLAGLYAGEEMDQAATRQITPPVAPAAQEGAPQPRERPTRRQGDPDTRLITEAQHKRLWAIARDAGRDEDDVRDYAASLGYVHDDDPLRGDTSKIQRQHYEQVTDWLHEDDSGA